MAFILEIPRSNNEPLSVASQPGEVLFMLGANGTGKSSLMHYFYRSHQHLARRISAHRQTWFKSNAISLTASNRRDTETNIRNHDSNLNSRWSDDYSAARANTAIYDLVDAQNVRARTITDAVDNDRIDLAKTLSIEESPIKVTNKLLRLSNIPVEISLKEGEQIVAKKAGSSPYSVAELSDGERNALLIAAEVLTASKGTLVLIDEPERHLHRSIISPLLTSLFAERPDCVFMVSTHEIMLPLDNPGARTLLVRGCTYAGSSVNAWDVDLVTSEIEIDDDLRKDILGARRKLLFVEGVERSLDKPLYSLAFPGVSVIAKSSCRDVEHATLGIRQSGNLNWLQAYGLVDDDRRVEADIEDLKGKGVYALSVYSVESIYYHPEIQRRVAERHSSVTGEDANTLVTHATAAALEAVQLHAQRMSERAVEKTLRNDIVGYLPSRKQIAAAMPIQITIDVATAVAEERDRLQKALDAGDLSQVIACYPVRDTPALGKIADKLGFKNREQYETSVQKLLIDDKGALVFVRSLFRSLAVDIGVT